MNFGYKSRSKRLNLSIGNPIASTSIDYKQPKKNTTKPLTKENNQKMKLSLRIDHKIIERPNLDPLNLNVPKSKTKYPNTVKKEILCTLKKTKLMAKDISIEYLSIII